MKLNKKGFTLVELIVVMAIIAVLAAILVPTMLGFMNNAKFTQANANAKTVYTAVNSVVADYCTDHAALTGSSAIRINVPATGATNAGKVPDITLGTGTDAETIKMSSFLEGMNGNSTSVLNSTGTGVQYTCWSLGTLADDQTQVVKADQKKANAKGNTAYSGSDIIGCYPLA